MHAYVIYIPKIIISKNMAALSAVCITPFLSWFHDLDGLDDVICVVTLGDPFDYVIPSFDTLTTAPDENLGLW